MWKQLSSKNKEKTNKKRIETTEKEVVMVVLIIIFSFMIPTVFSDFLSFQSWTLTVKGLGQGWRSERTWFGFENNSAGLKIAPVKT